MPTPTVLAISLGSSHICSVHLKVNPSGSFELQDYRIDEVGFSSNDVLLWLKAVSSHLDAIALNFGGRPPVHFSIPGHVALCKFLKIPLAGPRQREKLIRFEARQNIPYPIEEVTWDATALGEDDLDFETAIAAVRTEAVESLARYAKDAEMKLASIQPSAAALVNGFRCNYASEFERGLLVSIGSRSTDVVAVEGKRFFARNVAFGGQSVTAEMAETLGVSHGEAEGYKLAASKGEAIDADIQRAYDAARRNFVRRLNADLIRSTTLLKRQGFEAEPECLLLCGGGSLLSGLSDDLETGSGLKVERFDPLRKMGFANEALGEHVQSAAPFLSEAIGAAVGQFMPDAAAIDLTPKSILRERLFRRQKPFYLLAALVACGAVSLPILNTSLEIRAYEQELDNLDVQIRPLRAVNQEIFETSERLREIKRVLDEAGRLAAVRSDWIEFLDDLQRRLFEVEDVWLDKLRVERADKGGAGNRGRPAARRPDSFTRLKVAGRLIDVENPVSSVSPDSYERVKALIENLQEGEVVGGLEAEQFDYSIPGILRFEFTLVLKEDVPL